MKQNGLHEGVTPKSVLHAGPSRPDAGPCSKPRRLPTHQWHAKRFVLRASGGWLVPMHAHGKGKRSRSLARAVRESAVLEEQSHYTWLHISASDTDALWPQLSKVLVAPAEPNQSSNDVACVTVAQLRQLCQRTGSTALQCWLRGTQLLGPCLVVATDRDGLMTLHRCRSAVMHEAAWEVSHVLVRVHPLMARDAQELLQACCCDVQGTLL